MSRATVPSRKGTTLQPAPSTRPASAMELVGASASAHTVAEPLWNEERDRWERVNSRDTSREGKKEMGARRYRWHGERYREERDTERRETDRERQTKRENDKRRDRDTETDIASKNREKDESKATGEEDKSNTNKHYQKSREER